MKNRWNQFDGLRVFALIVIFASHTAALGMYGQGSVSVNLFFLMSGFFCTCPMEKDGEERFATLRGWCNFYLLRIVRIIPLYWLTIWFFYWISDTAFPGVSNVIDNMFFRNAYGHLWFLQHDMLGYLFVPFIMLFVYILKNKGKIKNGWIGCILMIIGVSVSYYLLHRSELFLWWNGGTRRRIFSGFLIIGMALGYFVKALNGVHFKKKWIYNVLDVIEIFLLLTISVFTSARFLSLFNKALSTYYIGWHRQVTCALICALLIFVVAINTDGLVTRVLGTKILGRFGQASMGAYLIHFFLLEFIGMIPIKRFVMITMISFSVALVLYEYLEKPLYRKVKSVLNVL